MTTDPIDVAVQEDRSGPPESYFVPATDIYATPDELVLVADMPGVTTEGLDVTVEEGVLHVRGRPETEQPEGEPLLEEFATGEFYRTFRLPADYDVEGIRATLSRGVLTLRLPKSERLKPKRIEVTVE